jgi:hypothetical protein
MLEKARDVCRTCPEGDKEDTAAKRDVLQEVPK